MMSQKKRKKLRGKVQKVIKPILQHETEKIEISVEDADDLYREIRVENVVEDEKGEKARLKPGAEIDVVLEADPKDTIKEN